VIEVSDLSWIVRDGRKSTRAILKDINFRVSQGKFVGIIGPNGAGKSSLMRCLYRVQKPTTGQVCVGGSDIWQISSKQAAQQTAVILQEHSDHMGLTVREVIAQGLTPHKSLFEFDNADDNERIDALLCQTELTEMQNSPFSHLSGGEKQRAFLARAILQNPKLLVMDEPTNHLDIHFQLEVLKIVSRLPVTVFASFHDLNLAAAFCDELIVLDEGKLVSQGTPEEVLTEQMINSVYRTSSVVDRHPVHNYLRITYVYHNANDRVSGA
jgi:iron complex transport system ATP-binding protein